jgi:demethylmenaquinone methyltransferase/2-methoxy-6-polyprenyl-1,4-benzoquinol methylase
LPSQFAATDLLEVACGTGYWTQFLAREARSIVAVDAAVETLTLADERLRQGAFGARVRFVVGDAYGLPVRSGSFDGAFAGFWFSHVPRSRRRAFVAGLCDAVRPGALIVLLDNRHVAGSSTPITAVDDAGDCWQHRPLPDGSTHRVLKNFPEPVELDAAIAGFGTAGTIVQWHYYWAFAFRTRAVADRDRSAT